MYTIAWFPWLLYGITTNNILISSIACGMSLLAGYYPIGIQTLAISGLASLLWGRNLLWIPIGVIIGLPQLIPFLKYLPKTIRTKANEKIEVGYWEKTWYVGLSAIILTFYSTSRINLLLPISILLSLGLFSRYLPRISYRWLFTVQFCLGWMAASGIANLRLSPSQSMLLLFIQAFDLYWHNSRLIPIFPYAELPKRPLQAFKCHLTAFLEANLKPQNRVSGLPYPLFTGIINNLKTLGYSGGMQLKLMAKWRNDKSPNGSGEHDWFRSNKDGVALDRSRVKFSYSRKGLDWAITPIKHLYKNPRMQVSTS